MQVRGKLRHQSNESLVDLGESPTVPSWQDALLRRCQKELKNDMGTKSNITNDTSGDNGDLKN